MKFSRLAQSISRQRPADPRLEPIREDLNWLKFLWVMSLASPLIYLTIAHFMADIWFRDSRRIGFFPMSPDRFQTLVAIFAAACLLLQASLVVIRHRYARTITRGAGHATRLITLYRSRTYAMMGVSEAPVFLGFVLFLIQGKPVMIFAFGLVSLLFYAQSYPSESRLGTYAERCSAA